MALRNGKQEAAANVHTLRQSAPFSESELLARILDLGKQSYFVLDVETNTLTWPDSTYELWGRSSISGEPITLDWVFSTLHQDDHDRTVAAFLDPDWNDLDEEFRIQCPDGSSRSIRTQARRDRGDNGRVIRVFGLLQDVTEERRLANELSTNRTFLTLALKVAPLAIWEINLETGDISGNDQVTKILGYDPGELTMSVDMLETLCHPDDRAARRAAMQAHLSGQCPSYAHEHRIKGKHGDWIWILVTGQVVAWHPDGKPRRMAGTTLDITARKAAEQDVGAENKLLSLALRMGELGYFHRDANSGVVIWGPETYDIWGVDPIVGGPTAEWLTSTIHPEDRDNVTMRIRDSSWNEFEHDFRIIRPDGMTRYIRSRSIRQRDEHGRVISSYGIYQDVTRNREMENALLESEARFRSVFETSGAGIVIADDFGDVRYVNKAFANLLGYEPEALIGRSLVSFSPEGEDDPVLEYADKLRNRTLPSLNIEKRYRHARGHSVWVKLMINVADSLRLGERMFIGVAQDITARKEAEQRLTESRRLLEEAQRLGNIGHWSWTPDSNTIEWSSQLYRILGLDPDQPQQGLKSFREYVHADDRPEWDQTIEKILTDGVSLSVQFRLVRVDGTIRHVLGRAEQDNLPSGARRVIGTVQDLTGHKRNEEVLQRAIDTAEAANRAKSKFLASMSHELRTPLNAILGFAQLLSLKTRGSLNPDQQGYVDNIVHGGEHLLGLINDVLDLARIDSGQFAVNITTLDVVETTQRVIQNFRQLADSRVIAMSVAPDSVPLLDVRADQMRLIQVIVNLTSNAIKYNRSGGQVIFTISKTDDGYGRISIQDTGQGIPKERAHEVFQSFNRLGAEASGQEGTGIGLALSKSLVERMNGRIGFETEASVGSLFWVDLPLPDKDVISPKA
ncbi:MAG: PAS domain S-box protein [Rhodospirillaceae bacterium]